MKQQTVLITGGNAGIGKATAIELARRGADLVFTARTSAKGEQAAREIAERAGREVRCMILDLASFHSIERFAAQFRQQHARLDVLINNAGVILGERVLTEDGFEQTFGVNHLGHFLLTQRLLPLLQASAPARIINVSSRMHWRAFSGIDFDDLNRSRRYNSLQVYAESKLANLLFTRELARRLQGTGVTVNAVHPGLVASRFSLDGDTRGLIAWFYRAAAPLMRTTQRGAETSVYVATSPELATITGEYFGNCRRQRTSAAARDDEASRRLWQVSEALVAEKTQATATG